MIVMVVTGIAWIPVLRNLSGQLYHYLQSVQAYIAPPIAAVFFLGLFWKRINATGAVVTLIGGFVLGMARLAAELASDSLGGVLLAFATINFLHFAILLFGVCALLLIAVSLMTEAPSDERLNGLTYATTVSQDRAASRASWTRSDVAHSVIIVAVIVMILVYFSPLNFG